MSVLDGLVVFGVNRSGANAFPNGHLFVIPTVDVNGSTPFQAGDLAILGDLADNVLADGAPPSLVTPSGFTNIINVSGSNDNGRARLAVSYKILAAADLGATRTGMNGSNVERKMLMCFRMSRPVQSVVFGTGSGATSGGSQDIVVNDTGVAGNILQFQIGLSDNSLSNANCSKSPAPSGTAYITPADAGDALGVASATRGFYTYTPGVTGVTIGDHLVVADISDYQGAAAGYLILA